MRSSTFVVFVCYDKSKWALCIKDLGFTLTKFMARVGTLVAYLGKICFLPSHVVCFVLLNNFYACLCFLAPNKFRIMWLYPQSMIIYPHYIRWCFVFFWAPFPLHCLEILSRFFFYKFNFFLYQVKKWLLLLRRSWRT